MGIIPQKVCGRMNFNLLLHSKRIIKTGVCEMSDREYTFVERLVQMPDGTYQLKEVPRTDSGVTPGLVGQRSYRCVVCGLDFREGKIRMFREKSYGIPCGCYKDIEGILALERKRDMSVRGREEVSDFDNLQG